MPMLLGTDGNTRATVAFRCVDKQRGGELPYSCRMIPVIVRDYEIVDSRHTGVFGRFGDALGVAVAEVRVAGIDE